MNDDENIELLHNKFANLSFLENGNAEIVQSAAEVFSEYGKLKRFEEAKARILGKTDTPNQAMTGFDDVKAEILSTAGGTASVLMKIAKPARSIGSVAQNGAFCIARIHKNFTFRTYNILNYTTDRDIQKGLSLELFDEQTLREGDVGILRPGPFAYQFLFEPPGALIHRIHQPSTIPFAQNFDSEKLSFLYSSFAGQEVTRDHFFSVLLRNLSEKLVEIHEDAASDEALKARIASENEDIMDFFGTISADPQMNAVSRWNAVQALSMFRPEQALELLKSIQSEPMTNVAALAASSRGKLEAYLASQPA